MYSTSAKQSSPQSRGFGLMIVGDEILLGKRQDSHFEFVRKTLASLGLSLSWVSMVADQTELLVEALRFSQASGDVVFCTGGIGATPDDLTRAAAASAFGCELSPHPDGLTLLREKFGDDLHKRRQRLIEFPIGSVLIPNPINQVPGFSMLAEAAPNKQAFGDHHFVPGFPKMAAAMITWVLQHYYPNCAPSQADIEQPIRVLGVPESALIPLIETVSQAHPNVQIACLPDARHDVVVELGLRGLPVAVSQASKQMRSLLDNHAYRYTMLSSQAAARV